MHILTCTCALGHTQEHRARKVSHARARTRTYHIQDRLRALNLAVPSGGSAAGSRASSVSDLAAGSEVSYFSDDEYDSDESSDRAGIFSPRAAMSPALRVCGFSYLCCAVRGR